MSGFVLYHLFSIAHIMVVATDYVVWLKNPKQTVKSEELGTAGTWNHEYIKDAS